jgi:PAS domain S-box-containing protein
MEKELSSVIDTLPGLVWTASPDGQVDFVNRQWCEYTGLSLKDSCGDGWQTAVYAEDLSQLLERLSASSSFEVEARIRRFDGEFRWFAVRANPSTDASGAVVCLSWDIEDRKRREKFLGENQELLDLAQNAARAMAFDWYFKQKINTWSPQQEALYGLAPGTFDGTYESWKKLVHPSDWSGVVESLKHAHQTGIIAAEYRVVWPDGSIHWLAASGRMFFDDEGRPSRMVGFTADVTRRKMVEEELRHSEEALDKARSELAHVTRVMSLGALTASIAHEVNQPLSGIITNASTCMRMLDADPPNVDGARETARRTIRDGHRAADVIARLRALFSKKDVTSELVDLNQATREVIALSRRELERNRVILRTQLADNLPRVTGDRVQLQQVILNLLRNSSDAMSAVNDRPRELVFKTGLDDGDRVCLSVRDTGKGFDEQTKDRLFHDFYTTKDGGMGMGLSVSRSIIENHQGRLWAIPNDGPGVTFMFSIPRTIETHEISPGGIDMKDQKRIARKG